MSLGLAHRTSSVGYVARPNMGLNTHSPEDIEADLQLLQEVDKNAYFTSGSDVADLQNHHVLASVADLSTYHLPALTDSFLVGFSCFCLFLNHSDYLMIVEYRLERRDASFGLYRQQIFEFERRVQWIFVALLKGKLCNASCNRDLIVHVLERNSERLLHN